VLVIGYGNPLRGDDAAGLVAAERLGGMAVHQLTPELAERIAQADRIVFLDADANLAPGEIVVSPVEPAPGPLDHYATPAGLLSLARAVYGAAPQSWTIGIGGEDFGYKEGLTAAAVRAVERAENAVKAGLAFFLGVSASRR
jgi:hydrogenase maturation protease